MLQWYMLLLSLYIGKSADHIQRSSVDVYQLLSYRWGISISLCVLRIKREVRYLNTNKQENLVRYWIVVT